MIENRIVPNMNIFSDINALGRVDDFSKKSFSINPENGNNGSDFKTVLSGLVSNLNEGIQEPDRLMNQQMMGNPDVDIHDVMTAIAKADISISMAAQMTSKVVTAYNTVMNISI